MPFSIVRNDIAAMRTDCIVCPTDSHYSGCGGADYSIHRAAGPRLDKACSSLPPLSVGEIAVTEGFDLPVRHILHVTGPFWFDGTQGETELLSACYTAALKTASDLGAESIAIPLISSGTFGFPKDRVLRIALDTVSDFLMHSDMTVYIVVYDKNSFSVSRRLMHDITAYIDDRYVSERENRPSRFELYQRPNRWSRRSEAFPDMPSFSAVCVESRKEKRSETIIPAEETAVEEDSEESLSDSFLWDEIPLEEEDDITESSDAVFHSVPSEVKADVVLADSVPSAPFSPMKKYSKKEEQELKELLKELDEGFSMTLLRLIDERGMTDVECYKKANIDKKLFSKIRSNPEYRPSKPTVLAFAIALELDLSGTDSLLEKAGYALSPSSKFDSIIRYFIERRYYDILEINMVLFRFDQPCLGNVVA